MLGLNMAGADVRGLFPLGDLCPGRASELGRVDIVAGRKSCTGNGWYGLRLIAYDDDDEQPNGDAQ